MKGELEVIMILMMTMTKLATMTVRIVHKIFTRYECMDFGACVDVSDEEDPRAICECQVILFSQGVIFTMSDFHTFEVFF